MFTHAEGDVKAGVWFFHKCIPCPVQSGGVPAGNEETGMIELGKQEGRKKELGI